MQSVKLSEPLSAEVAENQEEILEEHFIILCYHPASAPCCAQLCGPLVPCSPGPQNSSPRFQQIQNSEQILTSFGAYHVSNQILSCGFQHPTQT